VEDLETVRAPSVPGAPVRTGRRVADRAVRAWHDGVLGPKLRRHVSNVAYVPFVSVQRSRQLSSGDRAMDLAAGFADHRGTGLERRCSDGALARIATAFRTAEADAVRECPPELEVRGLWAEWLDAHYQPLRRMLRDSDIASLRELLENLHRDPMSTGVGGTIDDVNRVPSPFTDAYYRALWCRYRDLLQEVRPSWDAVASPVVGNPCGILLDGRLVQVETLRHAHHATQILDLLDGVDEARILEIGGGLGGQAYQCLSLAPSPLGTYTIIDLPEVGALASYCLMAALGEEAVRLYGEGVPAGDHPAIEILPPWSITARPDASADLVFNAHSFSEMDGASAEYYLRRVERVSRHYFFHINHETRFRYRLADGTSSLNQVGSEMRPDPAAFVLASRRPQAFCRPENRSNTGFAYLYRRKAITVPARAARSWPGLAQTAGRRVLFLASSAERYGSDRALLELATATA
jgi:putative sugar O-methyltransferase